MPVGERKLQPEILDHLPPTDPSAIRSRADLSRINFFMGNKRWLGHQVDHILKCDPRDWQVIEIGAGDGSLLSSFSQRNGVRLTGLDLVGKPGHLSAQVGWVEGDIMELDCLPIEHERPCIVVCNLILHHFSHPELKHIGQLCSEAEHVVVVEPSRRMVPTILGYMAFPLLSYVTRHDMMVSIRAGFQAGELAEYFPEKKTIVERECWRGGLRSHFS